MITHRALAVWRRNFTVYRIYYKASLVGNIGEPLLYLFAMGLGIGGYIAEMKGMRYIDYIAPGLVVTSAMYSATFECTFGSYTRLATQRTFDSILATPVSLEDLVMGEILWGATKAMISGMMMLLVMTLFGLYAPGPGFFAIFAVVALTGFVFASAAMCATALSPSYEFFHYYFVLFIAPMFFLSGVFFPMDNFPDLFKWLSITLPATSSVALTRFFFHGVGASLVPHAAFLLFLSVILSVIATKLTRKRLVI